ncbi:MAG: putative rane transport protein, partial [Frankiales bacterium]|nr:putative rane transport protein [Frankiales bacterium]
MAGRQDKEVNPQPPPSAPETTAAVDPRRRSRAAQRLRRFAVDITPLRESPAFRRLWAGSIVSIVGSQMTAVAVLIQIDAMTHSPFLVGLTGVFGFVPLVVFGLYGGSIVDAHDRRTLMLIANGGEALASAAVAVLCVMGLTSVWPLYALVAIQSAFTAIDSPARNAALPALIGPDLLPAANAMGQLAFNAGTIAGPLLGGIIASHSFAAVYAIDALSFTAVLIAASRLPGLRPAGGGRKAGHSSVMEGLRWLRSQPLIAMTFYVDLVAMIFGLPRALFPVLAREQFHVGPAAVGVMYAGIAAGALLGGLSGGWMSRIHRHGLAIIVSIVGWGVAITIFGLTHVFWIAVVMLALAGAADFVSAVFRSAMLQ